ncbi:low affinity iron permease family protein [Candidatus Protochlamydia phocaeensis]|uniref:low affinity iron permease family protein n=1 Tax=Candidatus Protochlamydia phocaeensis TaxID=1414722 RepID=UPI0008384196|nr:low affinity iron permease family protein [Candidatus Protochlamydia phocaeensis]
MFSKIARWISLKLGNSKAFLLACLTVLIWAVTGPFFNFSDSWQLVINTGTTIVTFLMVFLIQNTQNRDTVALHLKLDEIIRSIQGAHNQLLKIEELTDDELEILHKRYEKLATKVQKNLKKGKDDTGTPSF